MSLSDGADQPPLEAILFLFPALYEAFTRLQNTPNPWGLEGGSVIEMQINPGEGLMEQLEDFIVAGHAVLENEQTDSSVQPALPVPVPQATHITLVGPLGSRELDDVVTLRKNYEHVRWYLMPGIYANRAEYEVKLAGVILEKLE